MYCIERLLLSWCKVAPRINADKTKCSTVLKKKVCVAMWLSNWNSWKASRNELNAMGTAFPRRSLLPRYIIPKAASVNTPINTIPIIQIYNTIIYKNKFWINKIQFWVYKIQGAIFMYLTFNRLQACLSAIIFINFFNLAAGMPYSYLWNGLEALEYERYFTSLLFCTRCTAVIFMPKPNWNPQLSGWCLWFRSRCDSRIAVFSKAFSCLGDDAEQGRSPLL